MISFLQFKAKHCNVCNIPNKKQLDPVLAASSHRKVERNELPTYLLPQFLQNNLTK